jgi:hypothetical protein
MSTLKKPLFLALLLLTVTAVYGYKTVKSGSEAYLFGYPLVLMELTRQAMDGGKPVNRFSHKTEFPDHNFRNVVRPNNDTLYSIAWLDLSEEPLVLTVPDTAGRYYVMPLMDAWTNVFATVGKRSYGTGAGEFVIVGPQWQGSTPTDMEVITAPTNMVWIIGRIQTNGRADIANVIALQQHFGLAPLSQFEQGVRPAAAVASEASSDDPYQQIQAMSGTEYFQLMSSLMAEQPPTEADAPMLGKLAGLGISMTGSAPMEQPGPLDALLLNLAKNLTDKGLKKSLEEGRELENGWAVQRDTIGDYGTNYAVRAAVAMIGLGALPPAEASYPNTARDSEGGLLSGDHSYRLHFPAGQTPPVNAFWSLTMYDEDGFLVANPIGRYTLGDRDKLTLNEDGSLDLLVQHDTPTTGQSNWLPAPKGRFALTMRLYYPKEAFLSGSWQLPAVERIQ